LQYIEFHHPHHRQFWRFAAEIEEKPFKDEIFTASPVLVTGLVCDNQFHLMKP
jgi:hypothetical protein